MNSEIPKPLQLIGKRSMLERVVEAGRGLEPANIIVVFGDEKVKERAVKEGCETVLQKHPLGTADALKKAYPLCSPEGRAVVTCSDIPLLPSLVYRRLYRRHLEEKNYLTLLASRAPDPAGYGRVIKEKGIYRVVEEKEASEEEKKINLINGGVYCMECQGMDEYLDKIKKSPVKGEYYLTDLVYAASRAGEKVGVEECSYEYIMGVNTKKHLREARERVPGIKNE